MRLGVNAGEGVFRWRKVAALLAESGEVPEARAPLGQAHSRLLYAAARSGADEAEVEEFFAAALHGLGDGDSTEHAWALASYGVVSCGAGHVERGHRLGTQALEMTRRLGDAELIAAVLGGICSTHPAPDFPHELRRFATEIDQPDRP